MRRGARARAARLRRQERLRRRRARALGRDRLGARRGARGRRARAGARALRLDAVALLVRGHALGRAPGRGEPRLRLPGDRRSRTIVDRLPRGASAASTGSPRRTCRRAIRGTMLMALSNDARLARARDGEQVGALGRLLDALRRPRRRLRADQGRLQDRRLPARAAPERAGRARARSRPRSSSARRRPSCATSSSTPTRCRPIPSSTRCSRRTSSSTARATSSLAEGFDPASSTGRSP